MENARKKVIRQGYAAQKEVVERVNNDVLDMEKYLRSDIGAEMAELHRQLTERIDSAVFNTHEATRPVKLLLAIGI